MNPALVEPFFTDKPALNTSRALCVPIPENVGVPVNVPDKTAAFTVGFVNVLFVNVSVVALPTSVSVAEGNVIVTSLVEAGPSKVALFVPLSESS